MIQLNVEEYYHQCLDFSPNAIGPRRIETLDGELVLGDTIVQCEHRKRCAGIKRYLDQQMKGETNG